MSTKDLFKQIFSDSFSEGFGTIEISTTKIFLAMFFTTLISLYIFFCYRWMIRRTFYSKNFNISLVAVSLITAGIILTIQSSLVVSLGMVGALSIVRFRTAIKEPMDLAFLFWSIGIGIMCGAGMVKIAIIMSLFLTFIVVGLDKIPLGKLPMLLVINMDAKEIETDGQIAEIVKKNCKCYKEKSRAYTDETLDLVIEIVTKDGRNLSQKLRTLKGVNAVSVLSHDGEVTF